MIVIRDFAFLIVSIAIGVFLNVIPSRERPAYITIPLFVAIGLYFSMPILFRGYGNGLLVLGMAMLLLSASIRSLRSNQVLFGALCLAFALGLILWSILIFTDHVARAALLVEGSFS
jgi:hypothetical protein